MRPVENPKRAGSRAPAAGAARRSRPLRAIAAVTALALLVGPLAAVAHARGQRSHRPPNIFLNPDRGLGFTRFSKASHDRKLFDSVHHATTLPGLDPAIEPYNLTPKASTYDVQSGNVRGSLSDRMHEIQRADDAARRDAKRYERAGRALQPGRSGNPPKTTSASAPR